MPSKNSGNIFSAAIPHFSGNGWSVCKNKIVYAYYKDHDNKNRIKALGRYSKCTWTGVWGSQKRPAFAITVNQMTAERKTETKSYVLVENNFHTICSHPKVQMFDGNLVRQYQSKYKKGSWLRRLMGELDVDEKEEIEVGSSLSIDSPGSALSVSTTTTATSTTATSIQAIPTPVVVASNSNTSRPPSSQPATLSPILTASQVGTQESNVSGVGTLFPPTPSSISEGGSNSSSSDEDSDDEEVAVVSPPTSTGNNNKMIITITLKHINI